MVPNPDLEDEAFKRYLELSHEDSKTAMLLMALFSLLASAGVKPEEVSSCLLKANTDDPDAFWRGLRDLVSRTSDRIEKMTGTVNHGTREKIKQHCLNIIGPCVGEAEMMQEADSILQILELTK